MPILQVILQQGVEDVLVVVTGILEELNLVLVDWYEPILNLQQKLYKRVEKGNGP